MSSERGGTPVVGGIGQTALAEGLADRPKPLTIIEIWLYIVLAGLSCILCAPLGATDAPEGASVAQAGLLASGCVFLVSYGMVLWLFTGGDLQRVVTGSVVSTIAWMLATVLLGRLLPHEAQDLGVLIGGLLVASIALALRSRMSWTTAIASVLAGLVVPLLLYQIYYSMMFKSYSGPRRSGGSDRINQSESRPR